MRSKAIMSWVASWCNKHWFKMIWKSVTLDKQRCYFKGSLWLLPWNLQLLDTGGWVHISSTSTNVTCVAGSRTCCSINWTLAPHCCTLLEMINFYFFLSSYVLIWFSIVHHYLCQCLHGGTDSTFFHYQPHPPPLPPQPSIFLLVR